MKELVTTNGYTFFVDDEDVERVSQHTWGAHNSRPDGHGKWYVRTHERVIRGRWENGGRMRFIFLHRFIMNARPDQLVDHKDHNGFNNTKANLRLCTREENARNRRRNYKHASSQFKGVHWYPQSNKWRAVIRRGGKKYSLGLYATEKDAALAYDAAARELFGEFAYLNFPDGG